MSQPRPVKIVLAAEKHLGFALKPPKCRSVNDPVPFHLETSSVFPGVDRQFPVNPVKIEGLVKSVFHGRGTKS